MEIIMQTIISNVETNETKFEVRLANGHVFILDKPAEFNVVSGKAYYKNTNK